MTPPEAEIRSQLGRILVSQSFSQSRRHRDFLEYIVEEALAGRADRIKGYTIATEVFGKDEHFDAQNDPYVRVEAGRLRKRLAEYYLSEGAGDPVEISLPKGSYQPKFEYASTAQLPENAGAAPGTEPLQHAGIWSRPARWVTAVFAAIVVAIVYVAMQPDPVSRVEPNANTMDFGNLRVQIESFENIGPEEFDFLASSLTQNILVQFNRSPPIVGAITIFHERDVPDSAVTQHDYSLTGTVAVLDGTVRVTTSLVESPTGALIWSGGFDESLETATTFEIEDRISTAIVNRMRDPLGPLIRNLVTTFSSTAQGRTNDPTDCYLAFEAARGLRPEDGMAALQCYEPFVREESLSAAGWATVSLLNYWAYEDGADLKSRTESTLPAAYSAAQRALDLDGNSGAAHMAMALVRHGRKRPAAALDSLNRLLQLNPPPSVEVAAAGLRMRIDPAEGLAPFESALRRSPGRSPYMYVGPALFSIAIGDFEQALEWSERIDAPEYTMAQVLWASLTAHVGQTQRAERHVVNIFALHPEFERYGRELIERWSLEPAVVERIVEGLSLAGIALSPDGL